MCTWKMDKSLFQNAITLDNITLWKLSYHLRKVQKSKLLVQIIAKASYYTANKPLIIGHLISKSHQM